MTCWQWAGRRTGVWLAPGRRSAWPGADRTFWNVPALWTMGAIHHTVGGAVGGTHQAIHAGDVIIVQPWAAGMGVAVGGAAQVRVGGQAAPVHEAVRREPSRLSQVVGPELWPSEEGVRLTFGQPRFSSPGSISPRFNLHQVQSSASRMVP